MADQSLQNGFPRLDSPFVDERDRINIPWYRFLISLWNRTGQGNASGGLIVPTGSVMDWAGPFDTLPDGWLPCDGSEISRLAFQTLFQVTGSGAIWGNGDGINTFNLPNLINRFRLGGSGLYPIGQTGGTAEVILTESQLAPHSHSVVDPGHVHGQQIFNNNTAGNLGTQGSNTANDTTVGTTATAPTGITLDDAGSGEAIQILPPYASLLVIIKS